MPFQVLDSSLALPAADTMAGQPLTEVGMTFAAIRDEVKLELANRVNSGDPRYNMWVNWGYRHVCGIIDLKELHASIPIAITTDYDFYALPPQVAVAQRLCKIDTDNYATGGAPLEKIDLSIYRGLPNSTLITTFAEPTKWFRWNRMLVVWPTPSNDRSCALEIKIRPDDLLQDDDSPIIPEEFHEAVVLAARYRAERSLRMSAASKDTYNDMLTILRPIINTDAEETVGMRSELYVPAALRRVYSRSERRLRAWTGWRRF